MIIKFLISIFDYYKQLIFHGSIQFSNENHLGRRLWLWPTSTMVRYYFSSKNHSPRAKEVKLINKNKPISHPECFATAKCIEGSSCLCAEVLTKEQVFLRSKMYRKIIKFPPIVLIFSLFFTPTFSTMHQNECFNKAKYHYRTRKKEFFSLQSNDHHHWFYYPSRWIGEIIIDAFRLNANILSLNTVKIITAFLPAYLLTRMSDEHVQCHFYDPLHHKNIRQLPKACHDIAKYGIGIPMVLLSSLAIFGPNENVRMTARIFAIGLPFVQSGKDVIKKFDSPACLRPWHEKFNRHKRSTGGFPSGHMANVTYMATLWGMRYGPKVAIPLSLFASIVFVDFLNCNRHYLSQLVAGAGLGVIFAVAANRLIEDKLSSSFSCTPINNGFSVAYYF